MKKIKDINVSTLNGETVNLMDVYKNKPMLILFFNLKCLGCVGRGIPLAYDFMQEFVGLNVMAIHSKFTDEVFTKEDILDIFIDNALPFPIYFDNEHDVYDQFECEGTPHWITINRTGEIHRSLFGSQENASNRLGYVLQDLMEG